MMFLRLYRAYSLFGIRGWDALFLSWIAWRSA